MALANKLNRKTIKMPGVSGLLGFLNQLAAFATTLVRQVDLFAHPVLPNPEGP